MRVRIQRTTTVPSSGEGGLPRRNVRARTTLTVGGGYDLPDGLARDLIASGAATRVVPVRKVSANEFREARGLRAELQRAEREKADILARLEAASEETAEVRAALEAAEQALAEATAPPADEEKQDGDTAPGADKPAEESEQPSGDSAPEKPKRGKGAVDSEP